MTTDPTIVVERHTAEFRWDRTTEIVTVHNPNGGETVCQLVNRLIPTVTTDGHRRPEWPSDYLVIRRVAPLEAE